jgi:hypothetical protein
MQNTFGEFLRNTPPITMKYGLTFPSGRMRPARARSSGSETLSPIRSSVGYTIDMHESDFSEATGVRRGVLVFQRGQRCPCRRGENPPTPPCEVARALQHLVGLNDLRVVPSGVHDPQFPVVFARNRDRNPVRLENWGDRSRSETGRSKRDPTAFPKSLLQRSATNELSSGLKTTDIRYHRRGLFKER